jgi:hypothetical protein
VSGAEAPGSRVQEAEKLAIKLIYYMKKFDFMCSKKILNY